MGCCSHAALGILLRLLYTKSSTTFSQSIYNERRTRLCCLVIPQKYNSNPALSRHLLYCYLGTKRGQNAYPFQKNCTHCTANLENILLCNSMDGLQQPDEFWLHQRCHNNVCSYDYRYQRCTVHFYCSVFSVVPKSKTIIVAKMLKLIHANERKKAYTRRQRLWSLSCAS